MAQAVSRRLVSSEACVCVLVNSFGIFRGQSGTGVGLSPSSWGFPCQYHSTVALFAHI
jgi:hypothetical protein